MWSHPGPTPVYIQAVTLVWAPYPPNPPVKMAERQLRDHEIEDSKNAIELSENVESQARMSDPALKAFGDERVAVTEEDVSN